MINLIDLIVNYFTGKPKKPNLPNLPSLPSLPI